jgi:hypothetical protein
MLALPYVFLAKRKSGESLLLRPSGFPLPLSSCHIVAKRLRARVDCSCHSHRADAHGSVMQQSCKHLCVCARGRAWMQQTCKHIPNGRACMRMYLGYPAAFTMRQNSLCMNGRIGRGRRQVRKARDAHIPSSGLAVVTATVPRASRVVAHITQRDAAASRIRPHKRMLVDEALSMQAAVEKTGTQALIRTAQNQGTKVA